MAAVTAAFYLLLSSTAFGQDSPDLLKPTNQILDEIRSFHDGIAVWWTGNAGWLIKADDVLIGIDLDLDLSRPIYQLPITATQLADEIDVLFVTHGHGDHFSRETARTLAARPRCTFVVPENCVDIALRAGITENRITVARPKEAFEIKGIHVKPLRAIHGDVLYSVYRDANMQDCGYLLTIQGTTFLHPGDTVLLQDHLDLGHVDVLFFSPTVHNTHIDRSVILINMLDPEHIFPMHFDTTQPDPENAFWTLGYPDEVKWLLSKPLQERYHKMKQGQKFIIK
jgi:L-ascorbate metabolism protein UlaG (beta-lactamase superfamily)